MTRPVTVVLGIANGVGAAIAREALAAEHHVVLADPDLAKLDSARASMGEDRIAYQHHALHTVLGLRNCLASARENYGRVDQVAMTPEIPDADTLADLDLAAFEHAVLVSAKGAVLAIRLLSEQMKDQPALDAETLQRHPQRGAFTFVLNLSAQLADPTRFSETVSQNAVLGVVRAAAIALAADRIRVNAIMAVRPRAEKTESWLLQRTPMGRAALADEIARTVLFMNATDSGFMTGQVVTLDGGRSILNGIVPESV